MRVVWLASYPKSGNTWLRFLIYSYLYGEPEGSNQVAQTIPDIHAMGGYQPPENANRVFIKSHFLLGPQHPLAQFTAGFIYVLRHPKDVLLSNLNFYRMHAEGRFDEVAFARTYIERLGAPQWIDLGMGNWVQHAASWMDGVPRMPSLVLRYEDLKSDPETHMTRVAEFIEGTADPERVRRAVAASSLSSMSRMERRERKKGEESVVFHIDAKTGGAEQRFVNKGLSGQSLAHLGAEVEDAFEKRFGEAMGLLGYA
ncbi:MAG: sulfotransferase domain-containing protein [Nitrospirota bacterium]|nr:sulfotransferase domain-containing protein [Nitrospirota bacterium]